MSLLFNIVTVILIAAILVLHVVSLLFKKTLFNILSIVAHIAAIAPLLYFSAPLELAVALYLTSLAIRCIIFKIISVTPSDKEVDK